MLKRLLISLISVALLAAGSMTGWAAPIKRPSREHKVYFADTPNELNVYRVYGAANGNTLMLIGGIQGDEPGGFLTADRYADIALAKGNLIVVPRANFYSIIMKHRGPDGDMNRQFGDPITVRRHTRIIEVLKKLIAQSDLLLNLHDGSGFFRTKWEGPMANPRRYGQSLIADAATYVTKNGKAIDLEGMARKVLAEVNPQISQDKYRLRFNNHRTAEKSSVHKEQRLSATFYALTKANIPAFGVETSKSLPSTFLKIKHHALVINAFMRELGIVPETPDVQVASPSFKFVVISVNGKLPIVLSENSNLTVRPGDRVNVLHIEANYERGLTCDLLGLGSVNDLRQEFVIQKPTTMVVRKDGTRIGRINIQTARGGERAFTTMPSPLLFFLVEAGGERKLVGLDETLQVVKGDRIILVDVLSNLPHQRNLSVNFKGFVPSVKGGNRGEDRGYAIDTGKDLMRRYSSCPKGVPEEIECYRVVASKHDKVAGQMTIKVLPAKLDYLVVKDNTGRKVVYHAGDTLYARKGERMQVIEMKSNVEPASELSMQLVGQNDKLALPDGIIDTKRPPLAKIIKAGQGTAKLTVSRSGEVIGFIRIAMGEQKIAGK